MTWQIIAEANTTEELQNAIPAYSDIPAGSPVKIRIELQRWAPIGKFADLAGTEFWFLPLAAADVDVDDVYGNWHWIEIVGTARGAAPLLIIFAIVAALGGAGLGIAYYISKISISANITERAKVELAEQMLREGYTPEQVAEVMEGVRPTQPTMPTPSLPAIAGISTGVAIAVVAIILLVMMGKKKK